MPDLFVKLFNHENKIHAKQLTSRYSPEIYMYSSFNVAYLWACKSIRYSVGVVKSLD